MHFHAVLVIGSIQANYLNVIQQSANPVCSLEEQMFENLIHPD